MQTTGDDGACKDGPTTDGFADEGIAAYVAGLRARPEPANRDAGAHALRAASIRRARERPQGPRLAAVEDVVVPGPQAIPARLYRPTTSPCPLVVFFHGGGWTIGGLESHDRICRRLAQVAGVDVLAVDYRLAPEHRWPAAVDDAVAAVRWARDCLATKTAAPSVSVAGDSAGGNVAALVCLRLRDDGDRLPHAQILLYPNTDLTFSRPSVREKATGWGLDADDALWFAEQWVPDPALRAHPRVSPLREPDLTGLPPALVVTAEHDVLRDEGDDYAARLAAAGNHVVHRCEPGLVHGFVGMDLISAAAGAAAERAFADVTLLTAPSWPARA